MSTAFASVLRRVPKAAWTSGLSCGQRGASAGQRRCGGSRAATESTFGGGANTVRDTRWLPVRVAGELHEHGRRAVRRACRARANRRSPSSRWTITHHAVDGGQRRQRLGDQRRRDVVRAGSRRTPSARGRATPGRREGVARSGRVTLSWPASVVASGRLQPAVELDGVDVADARRRARRSARRAPGPTSSTTSSGRRSASRRATSDEVVVDEEVLAEAGVGRDARARASRAERELARRGHARLERARRRSTRRGRRARRAPRRAVRRRSASVSMTYAGSFGRAAVRHGGEVRRVGLEQDAARPARVARPPAGRPRCRR